MLSRRVHGPRKVVLLWDPAVDDDASDVQAYRDSGWDYGSGHVKIKDGQKPTVFLVAPLTEQQKRRARSYDVDSPEWSDFVFRCAVHGVHNYGLTDEHGTRELPPVVRREVPGTGEMVTQEWFDASRIVTPDITGIAMIAWQISEARDPLLSPSPEPSGG